MTTHWSKFPTWWYRDDEHGLHRLHGGQQSGASQAALRVLLAVAAADRSDPSQFSVSLSVSQLEDLSQLSRPSVVRGITLAEDYGFLRVARGNPAMRNGFVLVCPEAEQGLPGGWAMLPKEQVCKRIPRLPHRGHRALVALKIYMTLIAARDKNSNVARLKHETLRQKSGAQPADIRRAISMLANEGLVDVNAEDPAERYMPPDERGRRAQAYLLLGNFGSRSRLLQPNAGHVPTAAVEPPNEVPS